MAVAACSGDSDDDDATGAATPTPPAAAATEPAAESPTSDAPASVELDACELVTQDEVETAIGTAVVAGEPEQAANLYTCSYSDPEAPIFGLAGVAVFVADNEDDAREIYDLAKSNAAEVQEVTGVGEEAYWDAILNTMQVVEGRYELSIDVSSDIEDQLAAATAIAQTTLGRLP
jgi:hypothetical protein